MSKAPAELSGEKLLVCSGGPRDRAWYTAAFWDQARRCAIFDNETPHTGRTLGYVQTTGRQTHPQWTHLVGTVLRWNPDQAATR